MKPYPTPEDVVAAYRKAKLAPEARKFCSKLAGCGCPLTALYLADKEEPVAFSMMLDCDLMLWSDEQWGSPFTSSFISGVDGGGAELDPREGLDPQVNELGQRCWRAARNAWAQEPWPIESAWGRIPAEAS